MTPDQEINWLLTLFIIAALAVVLALTLNVVPHPRTPRWMMHLEPVPKLINAGNSTDR